VQVGNAVVVVVVVVVDVVVVVVVVKLIGAVSGATDTNETFSRPVTPRIRALRPETRLGGSTFWTEAFTAVSSSSAVKPI
jgi:hypothetical protein